MQMTPLLGVGLVLIVLGIVVVLRDMRRSRRISTIENGPGHDNPYDHIKMADVEITHPDAPTHSAPFAGKQSSRFQLDELRDTISKVSSEIDDDEQPGGDRSDQTEANWAALKGRLAACIDSINSVLGDVSVEIGGPGQSGWSFNNRGFGNFRRVMMGGDSVAWLRMELTNDRRFICALRSHGDEKSALNARESITAQALSDQAISGLIAHSMQPITKYAARNTSRMVSDRDVSKTLWDESRDVVMEALSSAGTALGESESQLDVASKPVWDAKTKRFRLAVRVRLQQRDVAMMHISRSTTKHIECRVTPIKNGPARLNQREQIEVADIDVLELADLFLTCAWPSIEHAWNELHGDKSQQRV